VGSVGGRIKNNDDDYAELDHHFGSSGWLSKWPVQRWPFNQLRLSKLFSAFKRPLTRPLSHEAIDVPRADLNRPDRRPSFGLYHLNQLNFVHGSPNRVSLILICLFCIIATIGVLKIETVRGDFGVFSRSAWKTTSQQVRRDWRLIRPRLAADKWNPDDRLVAIRAQGFFGIRFVRVGCRQTCSQYIRRPRERQDRYFDRALPYRSPI
jgi:hypothetical protein